MCERGQADNSMASEGAADKLLMLLGVTRALLNEHSKIYSVRVCVCVCGEGIGNQGMVEVVTTHPCF